MCAVTVRSFHCLVRRGASLASLAHGRLRSRRLLPVLAAAALLGGAGAHTALAQTTYSGGGSISASGPNASTSSTLTVSGASGTVNTIKVTLNGVTSSGINPNISVFESSFVLVGPGGQKLVLLGGTGDGIDGDDAGDAGSGLSNVTITVQDGAAAAPLGTPWQHTGSTTVKPSSYWTNAVGPSYGSLPSDINGDSVPQSDGSATLAGVFGSSNPNGTWTLYVLTDDTFNHANDPITVSSWSLTMTFNAAVADTTATVVSSSTANPGSTANSITYTATVADQTNPGVTVASGTVAFSANGSVIPGCGSRVVSGGVATCTTTFSTQGLYPIVASYTAGTGFSSSTSGTVNQLVETPTTTPGTDTWCNTGSVSIPGVGAGIAYPSVIKVTGASGSVANVKVELNGITGIVYSQHLLVAPDGTHNLDFFDSGFNPNDTASSPGINLNFYDSAGSYPDNNNAPTSADFEASDLSSTTDTFPTSSAHTYDSSIPQVPGTINFGYDPNSTSAHGPITETFESNFNGASPNGTWALYPYTSLAYPETITGGWCIVLTLNSGVATTTTLSSNQNPQVAQTPVTLTATVKAGSSPVTNGGTVTFLQNGAIPSGITSPNNVVNLNTTNGQAALTTGTVSSSIDIGNVSGTEQYKTIYEGDYDMSADYSGVSGLDNISTGNLWQRFNNNTSLTAGSGGTINACNAGPVLLDQVNNQGAFQPNPSVITVANLPGTISNVTLSLNGFYTSNAGSTYKTESLLEGPTGAALDFFSNTGNSSTQLGSTTTPLGTLTFADSGSGTVPSSGNYAAGTYQPTAYQGTSSTDTFTSSSSGLYNVPGSFAYAQPHGSGTFAGTFGGTNPNGNWSLFFNSTAAVPAEGAQSGWCLNFSLTPVTVTVDASHSGSGTAGDFVQGESGAQITTVVTNSGPGPTGDPLGSNPLTVTDTLNSAFTYTGFSGAGWSCTASGQTVTCTNDSAVSQGSAYPTLTLDVNVSSSFSGNVNNSVSVSGADATATTSNTDAITVEGSASLSITKSHSGVFVQGSTGQWNLVVTNNATSGGTSGTVNVSDTLPTGYTLASSTSTSGLLPCSGVGTANVICSGTPGLPASGGSNMITLTVNIPANSPTSVSNTAYAWGGGDPVHTSLATAASGTDSGVTVMQIPATVTVVGGSPQSASVGTAFGVPLAVVVKDAASQPIAGANVSFNAPGSGASASLALNCTTNVSGQCSVIATANTIVGAYSVSAQAGTASTTFSLTNTVGPAANFILTGGNSQSAFVQTGFSVPLAAQVTDSYNNPISGLTINFTAPASGAGASLSNAGSCTTDVSGGCSVTATANSTTGNYNVTAAVSGNSGLGTLSFALTNNPPPSYVVNTTADDATGTAANCPNGGATTPACTLRDALAAAAATGTGNITFASSAFPAPNGATIVLTNGALTVPTLTTITGATTGSGSTLKNLVTVSGNSAYTIFVVNSGATGTALSNLIVTAGHASEFESGTANLVGGGIYNAGSLTVTACTVLDNISPTVGGGIYNTGTLNVVNSTFSGNSAQNGGGGGILNASGAATVSGSTFSGNSAGGGAGILSVATLTVVNSTVSGNSAGVNGGGIATNGGTLTLNNSIISGNAATSGSPDAYGTASGSGNLVGDGTNFTLTGSNNQIGTSGSPINATLYALGSYGGPTQTMLPQPGSAAICAGGYSAAQTAGITADQRGVTFGTTGAGGYCSSNSIDIGAVQTDYSMTFTAPVSNVAPAVAMSPAPAVTLDEDGSPFTAASVTIPLSITSNPTGATLTGGSSSTSTTPGATAGVASYSALTVNQPGTGDTLTATLALNNSASALLTTQTGSFDVTQLTPTLSFTPSQNSQVYGTAISAGALDATASYNTTAVNGTFAYTTTVNGSNVTLTAGTSVLPVGHYTITASFTPSGTDSATYTTTSTTASYTVTTASLTASVTASNKAYNATTAATITGCTLTGVAPADTSNVTCSSTGATFATKNVGTGITVTATGITLSGSAAANYTLASTTATTTANITAAPLTLTAATNTKTYDATTSAAALPTVGTGQLQGSDSVTGLAETYSTAAAGTGKTLNVSAYSINDGNSGHNYQVTTVASTTGVITAAPLTASVTASNRTYNGSNSATIASCALTGVVPADTSNVTCSSTSATFATKNAGTGVTVTATGITLSGTAAANYTLASTTATTTANITAAPLTLTAAANTKTYDATTSATAVPTVGTGQLQGSDTVTGLAETYSTASAGTGKTIDVSAYTVNDGNSGNNYQVSTVASNSGVIHPAAVTASVTAGNKTYDDSTTATIASCTLTGVLAADSGKVACASTSASFATKNAGTGITVSATGITLSGLSAVNYALASTTATTTANITAAPLTLTAVANTKTYDATTSAAAAPTVGTGQLQGSDTVTGLVETYSTASAGTGKTLNVSAYTVNDGNSGHNYQVTSVANNAGVINPASVTASVSASNKIYNATTAAAIAGCTLTGVAAADTGKVACAATSASFATKNVGAGITVTAGGITLSGVAAANYTLVSTTATTTANITAAPLTLTAVANTKTYDATTSAAAAPTVGTGQLQGSDTVSGLTETYSTASAGTGKTLKVSAYTINDGNSGHNYQVSAVANTTGVINPATVTANVTASNKMYNATTAATITGCTLTGVAAADSSSVTCAATSASFATKNAGTGITVTATGIALGGAAAPNYSLGSTTAATTANITAAPLTLTAATNTKTYDATTSAAAVPTVAAGQLQGSDTVTGLAETYSTAGAGAGKTLNVSAYTINDGNSGNNYQVSKVANTTGVVHQAAVTASVTAGNRSYDGSTTATIASCTLTGVLAADNSNVTCAATGGTFAASGAGTAITVTATGISLSGSAAGNYALTSTTATTTANITTAPLNVTASSGSFVYGGAVPAVTPSYSGFVGTDSASSLTTPPTCSTTATSTSPVGSYPSNCKQAADPNYAISYTAGAVSVTPATLTITAANTSTSYGIVPTVTPSYSGLEAGNTPASLSAAPVCSSTVTAATTVGVYSGANTCAGAADSNYNFSYVAGTATVTQAAQTISFTQPATPVIYGIAPISLSATASSKLPVAFNVVSGPGTISGNLLTVTGVGPIIVQASQPGDANYTAAQAVTRTIVVNQATLTIIANNATRVYGTANPVFTGTVTGEQNGNTFAESFATTATQSSTVGTYAIVPSVSGADLADYTQAVTDGTLTITRAGSITVLKASDSSITPGQSVTLTTTVKSETTGTPTGTVNFYDSGTLLTSVTLSDGVATYSTAALAPGITHSLTATYSGDTNFTPSASTIYSSTPVTVAPLEFTMTVSAPANLTVVPGQSVSFKLQVAPDYGSYAGTVKFAMAGLPAGATATFSPSSIPANGGPQTVTVTIQTAPVSAMLHRESPPSQSRKAAPFALALLFLFGAGTLRKRGKMLRRWMCVLLMGASFAAMAGLSGCGGHAGFFNQTPKNYTVTLTATSANLQHSDNITLNVQ